MSLPTASKDSQDDTATPRLSIDEKIKIACKKALPSVVLVTFTPKNLQDVRDHMDLIHKDSSVKKQKIDEHLKHPGSSSTGFVVAETSTYIFVVTCAHAVEHCYTKDNPISIEMHERLFNITITCDHLELEYRENKVKNRYRKHFKATIVQMNCKKDLCLLMVNKSTLQRYCRRSHPPMNFAKSTPGALDMVGMVSWPEHRHRTMCKGLMYHQLREAYEFAREDLGYDFVGVEVNIIGEFGCSGAPCINIDGDIFGALRGGIIDCISDYISLTDLTTELTNWGIDISYRSQDEVIVANQNKSS